MAGKVVNLNRFRKKKAREEQAKRADTNRRLHGRTGAEKERERLERERAARALEGKRLERAQPSNDRGAVVAFTGRGTDTAAPLESEAESVEDADADDLV